MIFTLPSVGLRSRYSFTTVTTRCFRRMANKAGIEHRYSCLAPGVHPENAAVSMPKDSMRAAISPIPGHGEAFHCRHLVVATDKLEIFAVWRDRRPARAGMARDAGLFRGQGADPLWGKAMAVVCPTGGYLHSEAGPAVYRVGDRLAHIPPFTGDGIAIALGSGALAAEHIQEVRSPGAYLTAARQLTGRTIRLAGAVSGLAATGAGPSVLLGSAVLMPKLIGTIARGTRLPLAAR
jgi:hypothetical protein